MQGGLCGLPANFELHEEENMVFKNKLRIGVMCVLFVLGLSAGSVLPLFPAPLPVEAAPVDLMAYWNFHNCKWAEYHNYIYSGGQLTLVNSGTNYKTFERIWTSRCCQGGDRDPCGSNTNYVRWNLKAESDACYWGPDAGGEDLAFYFDTNALTKDWTHPPHGEIRVVAGWGWVEMLKGYGGGAGTWRWTMCGDPDPIDNEYAGDMVRRFPGVDGDNVLPMVYSPRSWDFSENGAWVYCTHATHQNYAATPSGMCNLGSSPNDPWRVDWCTVVDYLGYKSGKFGTNGQFSGNVIRVTQFEGAYKLDRADVPSRISWDVVEEWYLMEGVGIVELRQWMQGVHKVTMKLHRWGKANYSSDNSYDCYCWCCIYGGTNCCNQCYCSGENCVYGCP